MLLRPPGTPGPTTPPPSPQPRIESFASYWNRASRKIAERRASGDRSQTVDELKPERNHGSITAPCAGRHARIDTRCERAGCCRALNPTDTSCKIRRLVRSRQGRISMKEGRACALRDGELRCDSGDGDADGLWRAFGSGEVECRGSGRLDRYRVVVRRERWCRASGWSRRARGDRCRCGAHRQVRRTPPERVRGLRVGSALGLRTGRRGPHFATAVPPHDVLILHHT
ncbi:MAG: hypothetical protein JWN62_686 [Acidimicrobiales bacterium]|nr:hypothetical protein [Acidimicrobiales bacterium]